MNIEDLLSLQKLSISEVAYKVGFNLPNSFSRAFKKEYNMTPSQFVNELPDKDGSIDISEMFSDN